MSDAEHVTPPALDDARGLLAAVRDTARDDAQRTRATTALAHLDDVWPLPEAAEPADTAFRGAALLDEAIAALITTVDEASDAPARARALRALDAVTSGSNDEPPTATLP